MANWRMKLRAGPRGEDMWPSCSEQRVAAITYNGIEDVDLRAYSRENHPPGWDQLRGSAPGSLATFAWDIRGGDTIYVADSVKGKIVGTGHVKATIGALAYRFDAHSPIASGGDMWRHLIDVDWDATFVPFLYQSPRAANITVLKLKQDEIQEFDRATQAAEHRDRGLLTEEEVQSALLLEAQYSRYTPAALRLIRRQHVVMSNNFTLWAKSTFGIDVTQERQQIDAAFEFGGSRYLAEFKIAYQGNTKRAIREALGQILEYNHYPPRISHDHWLLILDTAPCQEDIIFLGFLRKAFHFPLTLGWAEDSAFAFEPPLPF